MHEFTESVTKRKHLRLLTVDDRSTEFRLNAFIFSNQRIVESLFDEDSSQFTVRHRPILAVLWILVASMGHPLLLLGDVDGCEAYRVYDFLSRRLKIRHDVLHY